MIIEILSASVATFFFAILFNVKKEHLILAALGGGLAIFIYEISIYFNMNSYSAIFIAAIILAIYCEILARIKKTTVTTFAICALIPLVPGKCMYVTMISFVNNDLDQALVAGLNTLASAGLLALGILLVSTFAKSLKRNKI